MKAPPKILWSIEHIDLGEQTIQFDSGSRQQVYTELLRLTAFEHRARLPPRQVGTAQLRIETDKQVAVLSGNVASFRWARMQKLAGELVAEVLMRQKWGAVDETPRTVELVRGVQDEQPMFCPVCHEVGCECDKPKRLT